MDCSGNEFPFSRGVSFYEVGPDGLIRSARDCVEPALKPGASALYVRAMSTCACSAWGLDPAQARASSVSRRQRGARRAPVAPGRAGMHACAAPGRACRPWSVPATGWPPAQALKLLTPLVRKLGPAANPGNLNKVSKVAVGLGLFYAAYLYVIMIAQWPPGPPGIATPPRVFVELFNESINFFYLNIFASWAGLPGLSSHAVRLRASALRHRAAGSAQVVAMKHSSWTRT